MGMFVALAATIVQNGTNLATIVGDFYYIIIILLAFVSSFTSIDFNILKES
jgi:hypothetical protein